MVTTYLIIINLAQKVRKFVLVVYFFAVTTLLGNKSCTVGKPVNFPFKMYHSCKVRNTHVLEKQLSFCTHENFAKSSLPVKGSNIRFVDIIIIIANK